MATAVKTMGLDTEQQMALLIPHGCEDASDPRVLVLPWREVKVLAAQVMMHEETALREAEAEEQSKKLVVVPSIVPLQRRRS